MYGVLFSFIMLIIRWVIERKPMHVCLSLFSLYLIHTHTKYNFTFTFSIFDSNFKNRNRLPWMPRKKTHTNRNSAFFHIPTKYARNILKFAAATTKQYLNHMINACREQRNVFRGRLREEEREIKRLKAIRNSNYSSNLRNTNTHIFWSGRGGGRRGICILADCVGMQNMRWNKLIIDDIEIENTVNIRKK